MAFFPPSPPPQGLCLLSFIKQLLEHFNVKSLSCLISIPQSQKNSLTVIKHYFKGCLLLCSARTGRREDREGWE